MSSQTVFRVNPGHGFEGLQECHEPIPTIAAHEVLVKVRSVSLNYRDIAIANSTYPLPVKEKVIPCSDMAGQVTRVGGQVNSLAVGDAVTVPLTTTTLYGPCLEPGDTFGGSKDGVLCEYIALPAHAVIKLPKSSHSFDQWASLVCAGSTVWNAFYGNQPLRPGQTVLLLGTGGVSLTALIFAKAAGATAIITSSSDEKLQLVKSKFGADYTINYKSHPNWAAEVQRITHGRGVDHVIEVTGSGTIQQSLEAVAYGGIVSLVGFLASAAPDKMPDIIVSAIAKGCTIRGVLGGSKQQLEEAVNFVASRELEMPVDKTYGYSRDDIISALQYVQSGKHMGKVCINLN